MSTMRAPVIALTITDLQRLDATKHEALKAQEPRPGIRSGALAQHRTSDSGSVDLSSVRLSVRMFLRANGACERSQEQVPSLIEWATGLLPAHDILGSHRPDSAPGAR